MKDVASIVITTGCLALVGLGIYLFSSNNDTANNPSNQKAGKKTSNIANIKKQFDADDESINEYYDTTNDFINDTNDDTNESGDNIVYEKYKSKSRPKQKTIGKTKKNKSKFAGSKKNYYY